MLAYANVGTNDLAAARAFYAPLFEHLGYPVHYEDENVVSWGDPDDDSVPRFFVCRPFDEADATVGNGSMNAFRADSATAVRRLYELAMRHGGKDEGAPGYRPESYGDKFFVAYVRDPAGNKLAFCCYDGKANP